MENIDKIIADKMIDFLTETGNYPISLHKEKSFFIELETVNPKYFLLYTTQQLANSSFQCFSICIPSIWLKIKKNDIKYILTALTEENDKEGVLNILIFLKKSIGLESFKYYASLSNMTGSLVWKNITNDIEYWNKLSNMDEVMEFIVKESNIDLSDFEIVRKNLLNEGFIDARKK